MDDSETGFTNQRFLIGAASTLIVLAALVASGSWVWSTVRDEAQKRLHAEAERQGITLEYDQFVLGLQGVLKLTGVSAERGTVRATFDEVRAEVRLFDRRTLDGRPPLQGVTIRGGDVSFVQPSDASTPKVTAPEAASGLLAAGLRMAGGQPPDVVVEDVAVDLASRDLPVTSVVIESARTSVGAGRWELQGELSFDAVEGHAVQLPARANFHAKMTDVGGEWAFAPFKFTFGEPVRVALPGGLAVEFGAAEFDVPHFAAISDVVIIHDASDLFWSEPLTVERIQLAPAAAVLDSDYEALSAARIQGPVLTTTLESIRLVAKKVAGLPIAYASGEDHSEKKPQTQSASGWNSRLHENLRRAFEEGDRAVEHLLKRAPESIVIEDATVNLTDRALRLRKMSAAWVHEPGSDGARIDIAANVFRADGPRGRLSGRYESNPEQSRLTVGGTGLDLGLGSVISDKWPVSGEGEFEFVIEENQDQRYPLAGRLAARDATVDLGAMADGPIRVRDAVYRFKGAYLPVGDVATDVELLRHPTGGVSVPQSERVGALVMSRGILEIGDVRANLTTDIYGLGSLPDEWPVRVDVDLTLDPTPVSLLFEEAPEALLGPLDGAQFEGTLAVEAKLEAPLRNASRTKWSVDRKVEDFDIVDLPHEVDVRRLMGSMSHTISDPAIGFERTVQIPPMRSSSDPLGRTPDDVSKSWEPGADDCGSYVYVPLDQMARYMHRGPLTSEDGSFFRHNGFNDDAIKESLKRNLAEERFVRGASTISMQLAKNLFLNGEKTATRKLREAFLVWLMESVVEVPKERMLEVYLNVIEYGPGIYGVWHGSLYYFGTEPQNLSVSEVSWFISTFSNPKIRHKYFERGRIPDEWWSRMRRMIDAMYRGGYIGEYELLTAKVSPPRFRDPDSGCAPGKGLNDPHVYGDRIEPLKRRMEELRSMGAERADVVELSDDPLGNAEALQQRIDARGGRPAAPTR